MSEEEKDDVVVLMDEDGNETEFEYLDTVEMEEKEYVVLLPVLENRAEAEEVLILRVDQDDEGEDVFSSIDDESELNAVFEQFKSQSEDEFEFTE